MSKLEVGDFKAVFVERASFLEVSYEMHRSFKFLAFPCFGMSSLYNVLGIGCVFYKDPR